MIYINKIRNRCFGSDNENYPYNVLSIKNLEEIEFVKDVTFIVGENGVGKSTLLEAIAINAGFNPEGGGRNFKFSTLNTHSDLFNDIKLTRTPYRNKDGYLLRAESFYNVATEIDNIADDIWKSYGDKSLHDRSHGESFLSLLIDRFYGDGLYILDEPEAALSLRSSLAMLARIKQLVSEKSQFIISTHSPILLSYPGADIYSISADGIELVDYEDTEQFTMTHYFINNYKSVLGQILDK